MLYSRLPSFLLTWQHRHAVSLSDALTGVTAKPRERRKKMSERPRPGEHAGFVSVGGVCPLMVRRWRPEPIRLAADRRAPRCTACPL